MLLRIVVKGEGLRAKWSVLHFGSEIMRKELLKLGVKLGEFWLNLELLGIEGCLWFELYILTNWIYFYK